MTHERDAGNDPRVVNVTAQCDVSLARRTAAELAMTLGFERAGIYRLATVVTELANNLVFHADNGGIVRILPLARPGRRGIEVSVQDCGPGIADIEAAMADGFSTNGGLGGGLPGCRRLSDDFAIESCPGVGTEVVIRLWR